MRIQEAARQLSVSPRMLRHYEAEGLIAPQRAGNGYRRFSPRELRQAQWIRDLIACGFSTRELRALIAGLDDEARTPGLSCSAVMRGKLDQIEQLIAALKLRRSALSRRLAAWERIAAEPQGDLDHEDTEHPGTALPAAGRLRRRDRLP